MSYDEAEDFGGVPEGYTADEDVLSSAFENYWDEIQEAVEDSRGSDWLTNSAIHLELLSIVSQRDFTHLRGGLKKLLRKGQSDGDLLTDEQLFAIASDISTFVEKLPVPLHKSFLNYTDKSGLLGGQEPTPSRCIAMTAGKCILGDDLSWAKDLLTIARTFRDILSALSDPELQESNLRLRLVEPLQSLNYFLTKASAMPIVQWPISGKQVFFDRCPDPKSSDLSSYMAEWISDYLKDYYPRVGIGVCGECGKFFGRERRDKTFCSKTCQNRVAYKRKKILESDALERVNIAPDDAVNIVAGLWMHHPRFGIGLIEGVSTANRPFASMLQDLGDNQSAHYRSMLARKTVVQVRFLHGVRMLTFTDLFEAQKKEEQLPDFYQVQSEETLAELL
ncbi:MAG TPA: hypothetical protein VN956_10845 [Pyrinomonadaceae bacterium]|nr:hypothetical protein [Pyrinomonadaceae bacterium]